MNVGKNQVLVLGPPGCGKTTDLLKKVDGELAAGTDSRRIGFVSFTRKAVFEAMDRAKIQFNVKADALPYFKTIHSLCFYLLNAKRSDILSRDNLAEFGQIVGYKIGGNFDEAETGMPQGSDLGDILLFIDNFARVTQRSLREAWEFANADIAWHELERFSKALVAYKESSGLYDFTDLLSRVVERNKTVDLDVAVIDEAQDLSSLQWSVLSSVFRNVPRIYIAGDDDQSIYKWSGADVETFLTLPGKKELLQQSHRVPRMIHKYALRIISQVRDRYNKPYQPKDTPGQIATVSNIEQVDYDTEGSIMFLSRNVYMLKAYEHQLRVRGISYVKRGGYSSVKAGHIDAIMTWEALRKGETAPGRRVKRMYEWMKTGRYLRRGGKTAIENAHDDMPLSRDELITEYGMVAGDIPIWHDVLENIPIEEREYYLTMLRLGKKLRDPPKVLINTIHGVKGGEADHVVVTSDVSWKTYQEYQKQPDNEHRVAYVAVTRTRDKLTIVRPSKNLCYPF